MTVFAVLGEFEMDVISWFGSHRSRYAAVYAEHGLIGRKPLLQATGLALDEHQIGTLLHHVATDPGAEIQALKDMQDTFAVLPFVFASGEYLGTFVIEDMDVTAIHYDPKGVRLATEVTLSLKENTGDPAKPNPPGVLQAMPATTLTTLDATTLPTAADVNAPGNILDTVSQTIATIGAVGDAASRTQDILAAALSGDVFGAIALAGQHAPQLSEYAAMLPVDELQNLEGVVTIAGDAAVAASALRTTQTLMNQAGGVMEGASGLSGLSSAAGLMQGAVRASASVAPALSRIQAFADTGSRLGGVVQ